MSIRALSDPNILVNNVPYLIVPNSVVFKNGYGTTTVRSATSGGGGSTGVHSENAEDKISMVKFEMYVTNASRIAVSTWKLQTGGNVVAGVDQNNLPFVCSGASMVNDPDWNASADGTVEIEFQGDPMPLP